MKSIVAFLLISSFILGCQGGKTMTNKGKLHSISEIPAEDWQKLSQKKIYFGHQSVGNNIIDGINKIMQSNKTIKLNIVKTTDPAAFDKPIFAHSDVGKNDDPESKIKAFQEYIRKGIGNKADFAFFKFCFWDIRNKTDVKAVFQSYKEALSQLKTKFPSTRFIHMTVPLMSYQNGIKSRIKRVLNMSIESDIDNIKRNELNELILNEYNGKEPVFDIAMAESTLPDGTRTSFSKDGKTYYTLADDYTNDGGHLNEKGQKVVVEQFLVFLAQLSKGNN